MNQDMRVTFPGGKRVDAEMGGFTVQTDQSRGEGGQGSAPSPLMYCLVALGTCAGVYVLSYLQARDLPTQGLEIIQHHDLDEKTKKIVKVGIEIVIPPGVPEKHRQPMVRAAQLCTVKKLFENPPAFEITTR
jgi:ribosomal protein S12 methylthiotransferase accessory factor